MIYQRGDGYCVSQYNKVTKKMRWVGTYSSPAEALVADEAAAKGGTVEEYAARWLVQAGWNDRTRSTYRRRIAGFVSAFGACFLADLGRDEVHDWAQGATFQQWEAARAMLNDALARGIYEGENPLSRARTSRRHAAPPLTEEEVIQLCHAAIEIWGTWGAAVLSPVIIILAHLGLTQTQVCEIKKSDVLDGALAIADGGWGNMVAVRTSPTVQTALLLALESAPEGVWLLTNKSGGKLNPGLLFYYFRPVRVQFGDPILTLKRVATCGFGR